MTQYFSFAYTAEITSGGHFRPVPEKLVKEREPNLLEQLANVTGGVSQAARTISNVFVNRGVSTTVEWNVRKKGVNFEHEIRATLGIEDSDSEQFMLDITTNTLFYHAGLPQFVETQGDGYEMVNDVLQRRGKRLQTEQEAPARGMRYLVDLATTE